MRLYLFMFLKPGNIDKLSKQDQSVVIGNETECIYMIKIKQDETSFFGKEAKTKIILRKNSVLWIYIFKAQVEVELKRWIKGVLW